MTTKYIVVLGLLLSCSTHADETAVGGLSTPPAAGNAVETPAPAIASDLAVKINDCADCKNPVELKDSISDANCQLLRKNAILTYEWRKLPLSEKVPVPSSKATALRNQVLALHQDFERSALLKLLNFAQDHNGDIPTFERGQTTFSNQGRVVQTTFATKITKSGETLPCVATLGTEDWRRESNAVPYTPVSLTFDCGSFEYGKTAKYQHMVYEYNCDPASIGDQMVTAHEGPYANDAD